MWPLPSLGPHFLQTYLAYFALVTLAFLPFLSLPSHFCVFQGHLFREAFSHHPNYNSTILPVGVPVYPIYQFICVLSASHANGKLHKGRRYYSSLSLQYPEQGQAYNGAQ